MASDDVSVLMTDRVTPLTNEEERMSAEEDSESDAAETDVTGLEASRWDIDNVSLLSFGGSYAGSTTSSKRNRREQGMWHQNGNVKTARMSYRHDLGHALTNDDQRAREFPAKLFEFIEDSQSESSSLSSKGQVDYVRLTINDAIGYLIESFLQDRKKKLSNTSIFDHTLRYTRFVVATVRTPFVEVGEKWLRFLFDKTMHAFINADPRNVSLVAIATITIVTAYITGSDAATPETIYQSWKQNIHSVCMVLASHRDANRPIPCIQLQHAEGIPTSQSLMVDYIFNSLIDSFIENIHPESQTIKYALLLTAVVHAGIMSQCARMVERSAHALLAMSSQLHKFKVNDLRCVEKLCDAVRKRDCRQLSQSINKMNNDIYEMLHKYRLSREKKNNRQLDVDPLVRTSLQLAYELAQERDSDKYEDEIRALVASVVMLRSKPMSINEECYKINKITRDKPSCLMLHEWSRVIQNGWTVFTSEICLECDATNKETNNFYTMFVHWITMDHRSAMSKIDTYSKAFVSRLLGGQRTSLKLFHNILITHTRARFHPSSLFGLAMPMFDLVTRPTKPDTAGPTESTESTKPVESS